MQSSIVLSILIPVYNWDIRPLLKILKQQVAVVQERCAVEIIILDDGSDVTFDIAPVINGADFIRYESYPGNRGRVAVRNDLIQRANGKYVLFLDADMLPDNDNFLQCYMTQIESEEDIVCGGISYKQVVDNDRKYAFYLYKSQKTEAVPVSVRKKTPWRYLFTSNIMLRKSIVKEVTFDPRFTGYGFEDIEWAIRLSASYFIVHINNTCTHMGVMKKQQVLSRMKKSLNNYALLLSLHPSETADSTASKVIKILKYLPFSALRGANILLEKLFFALHWNFASFVVFQCNKMILLTQTIKRQKNKIRVDV